MARQIGLSVPATIAVVSLLTGALAGIAGWGEMFGLHFRLIEEFARGIPWASWRCWASCIRWAWSSPCSCSAHWWLGQVMERNAGVPFALVDVIQVHHSADPGAGYIFRFQEVAR